MIATGTELRRFRRGRMPRLAVLAMVLMPLLYGALYLWAFWNPPGNLDRLPVALVNEDVGATVDGTTVDAGTEVTSNLVNDASLDWRVVDAATAEAGVKDGTYYFAVVVPENFSSSIASASGDDPAGASIYVTYNDANSFLATTLGKSAMAKVQAAVRAEVGQQVVDKVLVGLGNARDGFATASDGALKLQTAAGQLADGATTLADGASSAADGAQQLTDGSATLQSGTSTLADGAAQLADGAKRLSSGATTTASGSSDLSSGLTKASKASSKLASGAATTDKGVKKLAKAASTLRSAYTGPDGLVAAATAAAEGAGDLADGLETASTQSQQLLAANIQALTAVNATGAFDDLIAANKAALNSWKSTSGSNLGALVTGAEALADDDAGLPALASGLRQVSAGTKSVVAQLKPSTTSTPTVRDGVDQVASGSADLSKALGTAATGAKKLSSGATTLASGASTLATSAAELSAGAAKVDGSVGTLHDGAQKLTTGTEKLTTGAQSLATGAAEAKDGAGTLAAKLSDGAAQIPDDSEDLRAQRATVIASPVTVDETDLAGASTFGEGMSPFFLSLALFVGAFIIWMLMRPLPARALATPVAGWRVALAGYVPALVLGAGQVVVLLAVLRFAVGLDMAHAWGVLGFAMLVMAAFVALQQMFVAVAGPAVGKVVIMAFLMLQMTTAGGLYPVETTGALFRALHPWLPMTYTVQGLRELITGGGDSRLWLSVGYLAAVLLGSLAITSWRAGRMRTWSLDRLHPAISL